MKIFSFDRDSTLAFSAGPVTLEALRKLRKEGFIIGTGGGASAEEQAEQWRQWGIEPDFALTKSELGKLRELYPDAEITHIGNEPVDKAIAESLGFAYLTPEEFMQKYAEYDKDCSLCSKDPLQSQPYADSLCWATYCNSHPEKLMIVLNRHSPKPTPEESSHMKDIAEKLLPGQSWRGPATMPQHFHLHQA